ncbi:trifunctional dihydropteroate synthetase [Microbotryomycetes sp. JL221]|nr:trifunctional dihydropteroate synthetase [Microbotryomycetes sp. JL221]
MTPVSTLTSSSRGRDLIQITDLSLRTSVLSNDLWQRPAPRDQPLLLSLTITTDVDAEADTDSLGTESLNYGSITKAVEKLVAGLPLSLEQGEQTSIAIEEIAERIATTIIDKCHAPNVELELVAPRVLLSAEAVGVRIYRSKSFTNAERDQFIVRNLKRQIIVGLNPPERVDEQEVLVNLACSPDDDDMLTALKTQKGGRVAWSAWRHMVKQVEAHLSTSAAGTIETLTTDLTNIIVSKPMMTSDGLTWSSSQASVRVSKPCALMFAKYPSVQVTRTRRDFYYPSLGGQRKFSTSTVTSKMHEAVIGVGTNMGNRVENISNALKMLEALSNEQQQIQIKDTSFLYESDAMYHTEQDHFLNGAVRIQTTLEPMQLLANLKQVEQQSGRTKTFRNGPRVIDLDLLYFDDLVFDSRQQSTESTKTNTGEELWLQVPHASIAEREFVLRPLVDLVPDYRHPKLKKTSVELLSKLIMAVEGKSTVRQVFPLSPSKVVTVPVSRTLVMSIINTTPDSFSDGGDHFATQDAVTAAFKHLELGVDILDVGGMSTRPGAADVSAKEESNRVVPFIQSVRQQNPEAVISVDTFRAPVALAAIESGASIINDVCGGQGDVDMLSVMSSTDVPVILMHSRGTPQTMSSMTTYENDDVVKGVRTEMADMVRKALNAGVKRWNIMIDPGIGFAKIGQQNVELLRNLPISIGRQAHHDDNRDFIDPDRALLSRFPVLVGLSRKKFLGTLTNKQEAKDRVFATAAAVTSSVIGGADVVRIHDVDAMIDVVKVTDAIYRPT